MSEEELEEEPRHRQGPRRQVISGRSVDSVKSSSVREIEDEATREQDGDQPFCVHCSELVVEDDLVCLVPKDDYFGEPRPFHRDCAGNVYPAGWTDPPIFLHDMATILGRYEHTVRRWVRDSEQVYSLIGEVPDDRGFMPRELWPEREGKGWHRIYWRADQVPGLECFAAIKMSRRGWHGSRRQKS